jgi:hypothetical protein
MHRVLLLWLELNKAIGQANRKGLSHPATDDTPWKSQDVGVLAAWRKLTDPHNLLALERWLFQTADGRSAEWARKALEDCRERERERG